MGTTSKLFGPNLLELATYSDCQRRAVRVRWLAVAAVRLLLFKLYCFVFWLSRGF